LTGGIASGKSTVAAMFFRLGAVVLDADLIGHAVLGEEQTKTIVRELWGDGVFAGGDVDRSALAAIVFDSAKGPAQLRRLEQIIHPRIGERMLRAIEQAGTDQAPAVVIDAPLLFEAGWDSMCDRLVFVESTADERRRRARLRGWTVDDLRAREKSQMSTLEKKNRSSNVIDNSGTLDQTFRQVCDLWNLWGLPMPVEVRFE
jgi:dephospho-CoA kinase